MATRRRSKTKKSLPIGHHVARWLLPHDANDHRPHLIRGAGLAVVAVLVVGVQAAAVVLQPAAARPVRGGQVLAYATDITPAELFADTNQQRAAAGLPPLHLSAQLNQSANLKAQDMFAEDYWAHVSPSGIQPWYWFGKVGYNYSYAGENLAKDFDTSAGVMTGWMNSPGHRANILNSHYTDVGFAVENGTLVGGQTTLVVAHYGAPATTAIAAVPLTPATPQPQPAATPVFTPASTPLATPTPTAVGQPAANPTAASGEIAAGTPPPKSYSLFAPLSLTRTLSWSTLITLGLLVLLLLVYALTHAVVWRKGLLRWRRLHYRLYAAFSILALTAAILAIAASGFGKVS